MLAADEVAGAWAGVYGAPPWSMGDVVMARVHPERMWTFATDLNGTLPYKQLVPIGPLSTCHS